MGDVDQKVFHPIVGLVRVTEHHANTAGRLPRGTVIKTDHQTGHGFGFQFGKDLANISLDLLEFIRREIARCLQGVAGSLEGFDDLLHTDS